MYFEIGAPVFDASIATLTGCVCAADMTERMSAASNNAGILDVNVFFVDCMMNNSVAEPSYLKAGGTALGFCGYCGWSFLVSSLVPGIESVFAGLLSWLQRENRHGLRLNGQRQFAVLHNCGDGLGHNGVGSRKCVHAVDGRGSQSLSLRRLESSSGDRGIDLDWLFRIEVRYLNP